MFFRRQSVFLWLAVIGLVASSAAAQESRRGRGRGDRDRQENANPDRQESANDGRSEDRRGFRGDSRRGDPGRGDDRGGFGRDRGGFGGPPREITPEDRERFYGGMVERYMERYSRNYELTDQQKEQVRTRLEELKTQQRAYSEQHMNDFQTLRQEFWQLRSSGAQPDPQKFSELRERFDALRRESPLFNDDKVVENVEQLLPPEQVQAGRARRQAESVEREQRREEWRREWEQRRQEREGQSPAAPPQEGQTMDQPPPMPPPGGPDGGRDGDRESRRREWRERRERGDFGRREGGRGEGGGGPAGVEQPQFVQGAGQNVQPAPVIPENPVGPWEQYVRDFTRQFKLDDAQQATAQSVLREVLKRRVSYEQTHREDFEAARRIEASGDRDKRLAELNRPVVSMFEELKTRLMRIPSSAQRQAAGVVSVATSRPTFTTVTTPSSTTTRPAGERNREPANTSGTRLNR